MSRLGGFLGKLFSKAGNPDASMNEAGEADATGHIYLDTTDVNNPQLMVYGGSDSDWVGVLLSTSTSTTTTTTTTTTTSTTTTTT